MSEKEPQSTIKIEKTIRNAPVDEDELRTAKKVSRKSSITEDGYEPDKFAELLQDHTVKVHLDRVSPREYKGKQISGMVEEYVPPTTIEEVETDVRNRFGGGRYRIRVLKNGRFLGARGISVYGDPKLPDEDFEPEGLDDFPGLGNPAPAGPFGRMPHHLETPFMSGDDEISDLKKNIEKERLKKVLDEVKGEKPQEIDVNQVRLEAEAKVRREMETRTEINSLRSDMDRRFQEMMANLKETLKPTESTEEKMKVLELENKIERIKAETSAEIKSMTSDIKSMIGELKQDKPDTTPQIMTAMIEGFSRMAQSSDVKLQAITEAERIKSESMIQSLQQMSQANMKVAEAQAEKMFAVLQSMNQGGDMNSVARSVSAVRDIAESMGFSPAGAAEAAEPQDMGTRILNIVEKALPTLMAAQKAKSQAVGTNQLTKQEISAIIQQQAKQAAQQMAPQIRQNLLPTPTGTAPVAPVSSQTEVPVSTSAPVSAPLPEAQLTAREQAEAHQAQFREAQEQAKTQDLQKDVSGHEGETTAEVSPSFVSENPEYTNRVNKCLEVLMKEVGVRPRSAQWNQFAFEHLPQDVLEKLVLATDADGVLSSVKDYANPQYIEHLESIFSNDDRSVDWFVKGLNEMKEWYAEDDTEESVEEEEAEVDFSNENTPVTMTPVAESTVPVAESGGE